VSLAGAWSLQGDGVAGLVRTRSGGCGPGIEAAMLGSTFGTNGLVPADAWEEHGATWLSIPVHTGLGVADLPLRVQGDEWRLRLGAREDEFDRLLSATEVDPDGWGEATLEDPTGAPGWLEAEQTAWADGVFLLREAGGRTVGEVRFRGDQGPLVSVFDEWWLTPTPGEAARRDEGADIVLSFRAEPSLMGEDNELRINTVLREVVVPSGLQPSLDDRRLMLVPGALRSDERDVLVADARRLAEGRERERTVEIAQAVAAAARVGGRCLPFAELDPDWTMLLAGYEVTVVAQTDGCAVDIEPLVVQHTRRFRGQVQGTPSY
jgi:hypothetical protein